MLKGFRKGFFILLLFSTGFTSPVNNDVEYFYKFKYLKESRPPQKLKILRVDNMLEKRSIIEKGILVSYKNRYAKNVNVAGNFSNWKPIEMLRSDFGIWYYFLNETKLQEKTNYKFLVDGIWTDDPANPDRDDDNSGSYVSIIQPMRIVEDKQLTYRILGNEVIEFRIYNAKARYISIVGDFNNWNPENDILSKGSDGVWSITKRLRKGNYRYSYIVDGNWEVDLYNTNRDADMAGNICSVIIIK